MTTFRRLIVVVLLALPRTLSATVLVPADLGELTRDARTIARGRVVSADGRWTDDHRGIETLVTLEVEAYLKGPLGGDVQFRVPGGRLGRYRRIFVGAPDFAVGDRVIVFLGVRGPSIPFVLGLSQGVFRVIDGIDRAAPLVTPPGVWPAAATTAVVRGDLARRPVALADFERRVRTLAGSAR